MLTRLYHCPQINIKYQDFDITKDLDDPFIYFQRKNSSIFSRKIGANACIFTSAIIRSSLHLIFGYNNETIVIYHVDKTFKIKYLKGSYIYHDPNGIYLWDNDHRHYNSQYYDGKDTRMSFVYNEPGTRWLGRSGKLRHAEKSFECNQVFVNKHYDDYFISCKCKDGSISTYSINGQSVPIIGQNLLNNRIIGTKYRLPDSAKITNHSICFWYEEYFYVKNPRKPLQVFGYPSFKNMSYMHLKYKREVIFMLWLIKVENTKGFVLKSLVAKSVWLHDIIPKFLGDT